MEFGPFKLHPVLLVLLLLMAWAGGVQAACTETELDGWYKLDDKTLKPGAAIWSGADGIPLYDQAGGRPTGETLRLNEPTMPIEQIVRQEGKPGSRSGATMPESGWRRTRRG